MGPCFESFPTINTAPQTSKFVMSKVQEIARSGNTVPVVSIQQNEHVDGSCPFISDLCALYSPGIWDKPSAIIARSQAYELFKNSYIDETASIRGKFIDQMKNGWTDKTAYKKLRQKTLPLISFTVLDRSKDAVLSHSGILNFECDENTQVELISIFSKIISGKVSWIEAAALSLSGPFNGSFWANAKIEIPQSLNEIPQFLIDKFNLKGKEWSEVVKILHSCFHAAFTYLFAKGDIKVAAQNDLKRGRIMAHDPEIYVNENAEVFSLERLAAILPNLVDSQRENIGGGFIAESDDMVKAAIQYANENGRYYVDGQKHDFRFWFACGMNMFGVLESQTVKVVLEKFPAVGKLGNCVSYPYSKYADKHGTWRYKVAPHDPEPIVTFELKGNEKLSKYKNEILALYDQHSRIDLKSGMGSGKSYLITNVIAPKLSQKNGCKSVIVLPLNCKVEKDAKQYGITAITGEAYHQANDKENFINEVMAQNVIICNQNFFPEIARMISDRGEKLNVFIDEQQTIVSGANYKGKTINPFWLWVEKISETTTLFSGTPKPYFSALGFKRVDVNQVNRPKVNIVFRTRNSNVIKTALYHITTAGFDNKIVMLKLQDKKKINTIKDTLINEFGFSDDQIVILYSENHIKKSIEYQRFKNALSDEDSFAGSVKVVLCTSFVNEGVDLYLGESNRIIESVDIEHAATFSLSDLLQFATRWRSSLDRTVYCYLPETSEREISDYNALYAFEQLKEYYEKLAETRTIEQRQRDKLDVFKTHVDLRNHHANECRYLSWIEDERRFTVNYPAIMAVCEEHVIRRTTIHSVAGQIEGFDYVTMKDETGTPTDEMEDLDDTLQAIEEQAKKDRKRVQNRIYELYDVDKDLYLQAVRKLSSSNKIKRAIPYRPTLKDEASRLIVKEPEVFDTHLEQSEHFVGALLQIRSRLAGDEHALTVIYQDGDHGKEFISKRKFGNMMNNISIHAAMKYYDIEQHHPGTFLKITERRDAELFLSIREQVVKLIGSDGKINKLDAQRIVINAYRPKYRKTHMTMNNAMKLLNVLFDCERVGRDKDQLLVRSCRSFRGVVSTCLGGDRTAAELIEKQLFKVTLSGKNNIKKNVT